MDQATSSSWKLLSWPASSKKLPSEKPPKKVSALKRRLQAHAAIARSLSPFCARTSFDSAATHAAGEENKCLVSLSAFMEACSRCTSSALRDVHVPTAVLHLPHHQKAYIEAVHHHLLYAHVPRYQSKAPLSKRPKNRASLINGNASHTEESHVSILHRDEYVKNTAPDVKILESHECDENKLRSCKQAKHQKKVHKQAEPSTRTGNIDVAHNSKHRHCYDKQKDSPVPIRIGDNRSDEPAPHNMSSSSKILRLPLPTRDSTRKNSVKHAQVLEPTLSSLKDVSRIQTEVQKKPSYVKKRATLIPQLEADLYVCTTAHIVEQHKGKLRALEGDVHHYHKHQTIWEEKLHQLHNQDPPLLQNTQHKYAINNTNSVKKGFKDMVYQRKECSNETKLYLSDSTSFKRTRPYPRNASSLEDYKDHMNPCKSSPLSYKPLQAYQELGDQPLQKASEFSHANKNLPLKLTPSNVVTAHNKQQNPSLPFEARSVEGPARTKHNQEIKTKLINLDDCNVSGAVWMQDTLPVVKYSRDPYMDFHNSMLEMLLGRGLKDLHELQDMFVCYVLLNSPCNQKHIERAFRDLLTDLYMCKLSKSSQAQ
ncbi:hypothetical protein L7F22_004154 [Adiantum nelumboides]|nr:hypothetical protein [Adiantum nelumboides]